VPPFETGGNYHGTSATLEFGVRNPEVENIIVLGHAQCGGIRAWMNQVRACEQEAILVSLDNLLTFPWILERIAQKKPTLHGWHFDLEHGELLRFNPDSNRFEVFS
jgi:carbonic anhydrase